MTTEDIVIVGAGITGATLALGMAEIAGCSVVLVDQQGPIEFPRQVTSRVSALGLAAERVLTRLGVWQLLPADRLSPYRKMKIWDAGSAGRLDFDAADVGEAHLGHILENQVLLHCLHTRLSECRNITLRHQQQPAATDCTDASATLVLESGEHIHASLLVGADGARSWVREQADIPTRAMGYSQTGIVCRIATSNPHLQTAWQRFLSTGPVAVLPLADGTSSIVWSADQGLAEELLALDDETFAGELELSLESALGDVSVLDARRGFPLGSARADNYIAERIVLVGDAAHRIHPLAGQGANLGIKDVAALIEVVATAREKGRDVGGRPVLRRYERWRKTENTMVDYLMTSIKTVFAGDAFIPPPLRGAGMNALNRSGIVKDLMARHAMGVAGDLPEMIRSPFTDR